MLKIAIAASLAALASGTSLAQHHGPSAGGGKSGAYTGAPVADTVTVNAPTLAAWSAGLSRSLSAAMRYPRFVTKLPPAEGLARVRFVCSDSGAPAGVELVQSSGDRRIDRAALDAVRRIKTLHPLPGGLAHDQRYVAALMFATSQESLARQLRTLREQSVARADKGPGGEIALVAAPGRVAG